MPIRRRNMPQELVSAICAQRATTHGEGKPGHRSTEYKVWDSMKNRCKRGLYKIRGITVCQRWQRFENFLEDMGRRPGPEYSIERKDNALGYFKENCKWATDEEQNNNTSQNVLVTIVGKRQTLAQWARELDIPYQIVHSRYRRGTAINAIYRRRSSL